MNDTKLTVGNKDFFNKWLETNQAVFKAPSVETPPMASIYGMPVIVSSYMPKDRAVLTKDGKVVQIFKLKTWRTKRESLLTNTQ